MLMYSTAATSRHLEILQAVLLCWQAAGGAFESQHFLTAKSSAALVPMQKHLHGILQGLQLRGKVQRQCSCQTLSYWYCYSLAKPLWVDLSWIDLSFLGGPRTWCACNMSGWQLLVRQVLDNQLHSLVQILPNDHQASASTTGHDCADRASRHPTVSDHQVLLS